MLIKNLSTVPGTWIKFQNGGSLSYFIIFIFYMLHTSLRKCLLHFWRATNKRKYVKVHLIVHSLFIMQYDRHLNENVLQIWKGLIWWLFWGFQGRCLKIYTSECKVSSTAPISNYWKKNTSIANSFRRARNNETLQVAQQWPGCRQLAPQKALKIRIPRRLRTMNADRTHTSLFRADFRLRRFLKLGRAQERANVTWQIKQM